MTFKDVCGLKSTLILEVIHPALDFKEPFLPCYFFFVSFCLNQFSALLEKNMQRETFTVKCGSQVLVGAGAGCVAGGAAAAAGRCQVRGEG